MRRPREASAASRLLLLVLLPPFRPDGLFSVPPPGFLDDDGSCILNICAMMERSSRGASAIRETREVSPTRRLRAVGERLTDTAGDSRTYVAKH